VSGTAQASIIRIFHRWSGLILILLVGLKILSGYRLIPFRHVTVWVDIPLVFFFIFHASYGLLKIRMVRLQKKNQAFLFTNIIGGFIFLVYIYIIFLE